MNLKEILSSLIDTKIKKALLVLIFILICGGILLFLDSFAVYRVLGFLFILSIIPLFCLLFILPLYELSSFESEPFKKYFSLIGVIISILSLFLGYVSLSILSSILGINQLIWILSLLLIIPILFAIGSFLFLLLSNECSFSKYKSSRKINFSRDKIISFLSHKKMILALIFLLLVFGGFLLIRSIILAEKYTSTWHISAMIGLGIIMSIIPLFCLLFILPLYKKTSFENQPFRKYFSLIGIIISIVCFLLFYSLFLGEDFLLIIPIPFAISSFLMRNPEEKVSSFNKFLIVLIFIIFIFLTILSFTRVFDFLPI